MTSDVILLRKVNGCIFKLTFGLDSSTPRISRTNPLLSRSRHSPFQVFPTNKRTVWPISSPLPCKWSWVNGLCWCNLSSKLGPDKALATLLLRAWQNRRLTAVR